MTSLYRTRFGNARLPALSAALVAALGILWSSPQARAQGIDSLSPISYVSDFAIALSPQTRDQLSKVCVELDDRAHAQIAIVTLHALDGASVNDAAARLYKRWVIGYPPEDRGAMVLIVTNEHKSAVQVGSGLESVLPSAKLAALNRQAEALLTDGDNNRATLYLTGEVARIIGADRHVALASQPDVQINPPSALSFSGSAGTVVLAVLLVLGCGVLLVAALAKLSKSQGGGSWKGTGGVSAGGSSGGFGEGGGFGGFGGHASGGGASGA